MPLSEEKIKMLKGRPQRTLKARLRKQNLSSKSVFLNLLGFTTLLQKTLDNLHQHFFPRDGCYWQLERASDIFFLIGIPYCITPKAFSGQNIDIKAEKPGEV